MIQSNKSFFLFSCIYFFLALINLKAKIAVTPEWFDGGLIIQHQQLMDFAYRNHEQSRLLQFYVPDFFSQLLSISIPHAYSLRRLLFVFLSLICFHLYLKKWFDEKLSFAAVVFLAAIMPMTYLDHLQESATILLFLFIAVLWAIRENKYKTSMLLLFIGAFNNETILILPMVYFLYHLKKGTWFSFLRHVLNTLILSLPAFMVTGIIRVMTYENGGYGSKVWHLPDNTESILNALNQMPLNYISNNYLSFIFVFGLFWFISWLAFYQLPLFLQRAAWLIPVFWGIHFLTGIIAESRQMLPLAFLLIPMGLFYLFPEANKTKNSLV